MIERVMDRFGLYPQSLAGDTAYGTADMLAWLVDRHGIEPHIPVFDKSSPVKKADLIEGQGLFGVLK